MLQPVASATNPSSLTDVAITVHIAKPSFVPVVEVECHYAQTRYRMKAEIPNSYFKLIVNKIDNEIKIQVNQWTETFPSVFSSDKKLKNLSSGLKKHLSHCFCSLAYDLLDS